MKSSGFFINRILLIILVVGLCLNIPLSRANDIIVKAGWLKLNNGEDSEDAVILEPAKITVTGSRLSTTNESFMGCSLTYFLSTHTGVEFYFGLPIEQDLNARQTSQTLGKIGKITYIPLLMNFVYYPLDKNSKWQPYLGIGGHYVKILDTDTAPGLDARMDLFSLEQFGAAVQISETKLEIDDNSGLMFKIGIDYALSEKLLLSFSVLHHEVNTTSSLVSNSAVGRVVMEQAVQIDARAYFVGLGYRF